jgi:hypothetical protein
MLAVITCQNVTEDSSPDHNRTSTRSRRLFFTRTVLLRLDLSLLSSGGF